MEAVTDTIATRSATTRVRYDARPAEERTLPQLSLGGILAVWAAAALPMGLLAWFVAPRLADHMSGPGALARALFITMTAGLAWQFVLVMMLVRREQGSVRWSVLREALWLRAPRSPRSGRRGGRAWLIVVPLLVAFAAEELLFRGFLLPRMKGVFGRRDWVANGVLFAVYHLHMPWAIPAALFDTFILSYPSRRYRSALIGIVVHSAQSIVLFGVVLSLVLKG